MIEEYDDGCEKQNFRWSRTGGGEKSRFSVVWPDGGGYCREALEYGACPGWLPVTFIEEPDGLTAYYDDTDCLPLTAVCDLLLRRGESLLRFTIELFRRLAEAERQSDDFLLNRDCVRYGTDCIFIRRGTGEPQLAYIPQMAAPPQLTCIPTARQTQLMCITKESQQMISAAEMERGPQGGNRLQGENRHFAQRITALLEELLCLYPGYGLEPLRETLRKELEEGALGTGELLRRFSRWEREI